MNVVGDLSMQKHKEKTKIFLFCHCLKNPYALWYILSLFLLEFVQRRPMYLFHHVWCAGVSADSMLLNPTKKKSAWLLGKKSPCSCVNGLVVRPNRPLCFHRAPLIHLPSLALYRLSFCFSLFCFVLLILWHLSRQQSLPTLCCNGSGHASYCCCF